ncbi:glycoside hydrolase family 16 protein [Rubrivivax sp. RP6-9]|uniref:glycoside hydrolase family 16 protein n=1 Tax=Rubrivivax sp. RP6-9 TaxID=3415750 RepID=UPI003CC56C8C
MTRLAAPHAVLLAWAACGLLFTAGCGGGGSTAGAPARPAAAVADTADTAPLELVDNGSFALGLRHWSARDTMLVPSSQRPGGQMLHIAGTATQPIVAGRLEAGRSYTLRVTARLAQAGAPATLAVQFRRPAGAERIRVYPVQVTSTGFQVLQVDFTAPPYAAMGEVALAAGGTPLQVDTVSLQTRATIVQTEPRTSTWDSHVPWGYELVFNDEFNGSTLNRSKWFTRYLYADGMLDRLNDEQQRYRDNGNHSVAGGVLSLTARQVSTNAADGIDHESGMIRSDWTARHGYFEARVRMPGAIGLWPAFWLASDVAADGSLAWPPEIDIFEFVNNGVEDTADMLHSGVVPLPGMPSTFSYADPAFDTQWNYYRAPFRFDAGWHTVGAEWTPTAVTVYLDGRKLYTRSYAWTFPDGSAAGPAHLLLNLAVGGGWAGRHGVDSAALPQSLQIDWVRAYRLPP